MDSTNSTTPVSNSSVAKPSLALSVSSVVQALPESLRPTQTQTQAGQPVSLLAERPKIQRNKITITETALQEGGRKRLISSDPTSAVSPTKQRKRHRKTPNQIAILESQFAVNPLPDKSVRDRLGLQLGLTTRQVQIWFQNKRAKTKQEQQQQQIMQQNDSHLLAQTGSQLESTSPLLALTPEQSLDLACLLPSPSCSSPSSSPLLSPSSSAPSSPSGLVMYSKQPNLLHIASSSAVTGTLESTENPFDFVMRMPTIFTLEPSTQADRPICKNSFLENDLQSLLLEYLEKDMCA
jgi:hypothetical protein